MEKEVNMLLLQRVVAISALALLVSGCVSHKPLPPVNTAGALGGDANLQTSRSLVRESGTPSDEYGTLQPDPDPFASRYHHLDNTPVGTAPTATQPATRLAASPFPASRASSTPPARARAAQPRANNVQSPRGGATSSIVLGEGDVILFNMFGQEDMKTTAFVSAQGTVSLPLIGDTPVGGLTPGQAEQRITQAYRAGGYFNDPQVNVTLEKFRSQQISVLGEVNLPGRYPLETRTTVLDALAQAEGVKATGAQVVTVIHKNPDGTTSRTQVDLNNLVTDSGQLDSFALAAGDIVYVPQAQLFYIYGEVRRPDAYAIKPGMTVKQALSQGGGLTDKGSNSRIEIQRKEGANSRTIKPELTETVRPDDVIYVKERFF